jgi:hypothetical protein
VDARKHGQDNGLLAAPLLKKSKALSEAPKQLDEKEQLKQLEYLLNESISDSFSSDDENTFHIGSQK